MFGSLLFTEPDTDGAHRNSEHTSGTQGIPVERTVSLEIVGVSIYSNPPAGHMSADRGGDASLSRASPEARVQTEKIRNGEGGFGSEGRVGGLDLLCGS